MVEELDVKNQIWRELDGICSPDAIFASNTSSLTITEMAAATAHPHRVIGLHFFNPVPVLPLVEIVHSIMTADETATRAREFANALARQGHRIVLLTETLRRDDALPDLAGLPKLLEILAQLDLFGGLPTNHLKRVVDIGNEERHKRNEKIFFVPSWLNLGR